MIGERIGHLRVIASIGVGGMGAVWHAVDELLDRHVALKVIRPELMSRPGLAERFRSEAIVLARLQHPCIAALYGLEKRGEEFVMVMEYVDGQTLDTRLSVGGALPWPEATRITRAVLDALDHAHESGVIHRDIKPANVMITRAGRVKVMDFGIARLVGAQRQTRTGAAVGTPSYMSPEQLLGQEVDGRADVYAVGTLLYELTTGHLPFEVEGDYLRMIAQLQQIPGAPSAHNAELPAGLDRIVARALQKDPDNRFATSGAFRDALEELEREYGVLRAYGTPAAGSSPVPVSRTPTGRGTPGSLPSISSQPIPGVTTSAAALLTPVESAMSVTPVPFAIEPAGATPIDLNVPVRMAAAAAQPSPESPAPLGIGRPTPEYVSSIPPAPQPVNVTASRGPVFNRQSFFRVIMAGGAIAVVAVAGVILSKSVTEKEQQAAATVAAPAVAMLPAPSAATEKPAVPRPSAAAAAPVTFDSALGDSAALRKAVADSLRTVRKAKADSLKKVKAAEDSARKASDAVFGLDAVGPSKTEREAAENAAKRATDACVAALGTHDLGRLGSLLGGNDGARKTLLRLVKDGRLEVGQALGRQIELDGADRATATFRLLLTYRNGANEDKTASASFRSIVQKEGTSWKERCLIDNDGGAKF